jgi:hypothetical protein
LIKLGNHEARSVAAQAKIPIDIAMRQHVYIVQSHKQNELLKKQVEL